MALEYTDTDIERIYHAPKDSFLSQINQFENEITHFIKQDNRDIIVDLNNISSIDSISITTFIRIKNKLTENGRTLKLINPGERIIRVLELAGLESFLLE